MRSFIVFVIACAGGCTLLVGTDPRYVADGGQEAAGDASDGNPSEPPKKEPIDDAASPEAARAPPTCDVGRCYEAQQICKGACDQQDLACLASCNGGGDEKSCTSTCSKKQKQCDDACLTTCNGCVKGCAPPCPP